MSETLRLFVALPVPAWVREDVEAAVAPLRDKAPELRWVDSDAWHLTLLFLGGVAPVQLAGVASALAGAVADVPSTRLELDGTAGAFGERVLWVRVVPNPQLDALAAAVRGALAPLGFVDDKPFSAHLTIARAPKDGALPSGLTEDFSGPAVSWRAEHLNLIRSKLGPGGVRYEGVATWPLP